MDAILLDLNFDAKFIIDEYKSFIWTERYQGYGDFELFLPAVQNIIDVIEPNYYIAVKASRKLMIIENVQLESDIEDGASLKITGRSLESILDRRIAWKYTILDGDLQTAIHTLLNNNVINPSDSKRKIPNFIFEESPDNLTGYAVSNQYIGDSIYDIISNICLDNDLGFEVYLNDNKQMVFRLYNGKNRTSGNALGYPPVMFSPDFNNLISSNYVYSNENLKNCTLIGGEGEGSAKKFAEYGSLTGLARREIYTDSSSLSTSVDGGGTMSDSEYHLQLIASGVEKLNENIITETFEGEMDTTGSFIYGRDFWLGDILHIKNEYRIEAKARVTEFVMSYDSNGYRTYPNFTIVYEGGKVYLNDVGDVTITNPVFAQILRRRENVHLWRNSTT